MHIEDGEPGYRWPLRPRAIRNLTYLAEVVMHIEDGELGQMAVKTKSHQKSYLPCRGSHAH